MLGVASPTTGLPSSRGRIYALCFSFGGTSPMPRVGLRHNGKLFYDTYDSADVLVNAYESSFAVPGDGLYHFVGVHFDHDAQEVTFRLDATEETVVTAIAGPDEIPANPDAFQFTSYVSCSDLHLHGPIEAAEPWLVESVDITAYLDTSTLHLVASYEGEPREAWGLINEVVAAELAVAGFDEDGPFRYRTRRRLVEAQAQTVQRVLTAQQSLVDIADDDAMDTGPQHHPGELHTGHRRSHVHVCPHRHSGPAGAGQVEHRRGDLLHRPRRPTPASRLPAQRCAVRTSPAGRCLHSRHP